MGELLALRKPGQPGQRVVTLVERDKSIETDESVDRLSGCLNHGKFSRSVKLITKTPWIFPASSEYASLMCTPYAYAELYYEVWKRLKGVGVPVVPNLWVVSDEAVAMTDLTALGGRLYDKYEYFSPRVSKQQPDELDKIFAATNREKILKPVEAVMQLATRHSIALNTDDPLSILVKPDGRLSVLSLDISGTRFNNPEAATLNDKSKDEFMGWMDSIRGRIGFSAETSGQ